MSHKIELSAYWAGSSRFEINHFNEKGVSITEYSYSNSNNDVLRIHEDPEESFTMLTFSNDNEGQDYEVYSLEKGMELYTSWPHNDIGKAYFLGSIEIGE